MLSLRCCLWSLGSSHSVLFWDFQIMWTALKIVGVHNLFRFLICFWRNNLKSLEGSSHLKFSKFCQTYCCSKRRCLCRTVHSCVMPVMGVSFYSVWIYWLENLRINILDRFVDISLDFRMIENLMKYLVNMTISTRDWECRYRCVAICVCKNICENVVKNIVTLRRGIWEDLVLSNACLFLASYLLVLWSENWLPILRYSRLSDLRICKWKLKSHRWMLF